MPNAVPQPIQQSEPDNLTSSDAVDSIVAKADQVAWATRSTQNRASVLLGVKDLLVEKAESLHKALTLHPDREIFDTIATELFPLAEAIRWNCKTGIKILAPRSISHWGLNLFLGRMSGEVIREPLGTVLIIGTWNYPIFLTAVAALQALLAGNAVILKPAPGCEAVTQRIAELFINAGVPRTIFKVIGTSVGDVDAALQSGVELVVLTAASKTGRVVGAKTAEHLIPMIAELSGCDAMFVLPSADLERVADVIAFGFRLNSGAVCMAPRRLILRDETAEKLLPLIAQRLAKLSEFNCRKSSIEPAVVLVADALQQGAVKLSPLVEWDLEVVELNYQSEFDFVRCKPIVLDHVQPQMLVAQKDMFAPLLSVLRLPDIKNPTGKNTSKNNLLDDFVRCNDLCPYALSASVFGEAETARQLAKRTNAGAVTVNDLIAPTVEPSVSFGGRKLSGYGVTRGAEGLRQMSQEKSILVRHGSFLPHLKTPKISDNLLSQGLFAFVHGKSWSVRLAGIKSMIKSQLGSKKPPS